MLLRLLSIHIKVQLYLTSEYTQAFHYLNFKVIPFKS